MKTQIMGLALSWPSELCNPEQRALRLQANFIEKEFTYIE